MMFTDARIAAFALAGVALLASACTQDAATGDLLPEGTASTDIPDLGSQPPNDAATGTDAAAGTDAATGTDAAAGTDAATGTDAAAGTDAATGTDAAAGTDPVEVVAVSAGGSHSCGLRKGGAVQCWGANDGGQADAPEGHFGAVSEPSAAGAPTTLGS